MLSKNCADYSNYSDYADDSDRLSLEHPNHNDRGDRHDYTDRSTQTINKALVKRVREHVNPLSDKYREPTPAPDWEQVYGDWSKPLSLDIGCGKGGYVLEMAKLYPDRNWLGLEIREPLVHRAIALKNSLMDECDLSNLHYLFCNVNVTLPSLLPAGKIHQVSILFPDPWFKRRHKKRRVVQPELVTSLTNLLVPDAEILLQSDIEEVATSMREVFEANPNFVNQAGIDNFASASLYPEHVMTEREEWTISQAKPVYRAYLKFKPIN
ncbi:tRNA (guanine-N(7)-)-methyltransferase [Thalassoporum mexicanum PCC 7367]|uniref:tRNA (guanosine(46)-N7)-methyltransferase TrmB n=1 Tax=Thalassoporum mexicanum TaxID=3457544 RepID=UPI00029FAC1E|nr:tRNA (guanosine(46)-N7)-methyltransferase TrmB [Pseudanabaena sp. PCC 7367]AFY71793.1 tRNA (guanine-N(7)-)-methyltransferase [Pseudanabaena sp. PCC 7367]